ncbi:MAG TPA: hypothetical protein VIT92_17465, partial [Burkholderiaceae bacterium]
MNRPLLALTLAAALSMPAAAQPAYDPAPLVAEALALAKAQSYDTRTVDWPALEAAVYAAARGARDELDLLAAYQVLVEGLGDNHSFVAVSNDDRAAFATRH